MRRTGSERKSSKSKGSSTSRAKSRRRSSSRQPRFVVCVNGGGYVDLEPLKVYKVRRDPGASALGMLRVVDASGEDYLYPAAFFRPIRVPRGLFKMVNELT